MARQADDYDSPWKEVLDAYFREFAELLFPMMASEVDWERGCDFLDKEFQKAVRDAAQGRKMVDKLVRVWKKDGAEEWALVHVEVQARGEPLFTRRIYVCNYRVFDRYNRPVVSLAVLADDSPSWRPDQFGYDLWGCEVSIRFPVVKLMDFNREDLERSSNPFAVIVLAHLRAQETSKDPQGRLHWKLSLAKGLYRRGHTRGDVLRIFRFIDWVMALPQELEDRFWTELSQYEKEKRMPYVTSVERIGIRKGMREGLLKAIALGLELRFGEQGLRLLSEIAELEDVDVLDRIYEGLKVASSPEELRALMRR